MGVRRGCGGGVESDKGNFTDWTLISLPLYLLQEKQQQEGHEGHLVHFE